MCMWMCLGRLLAGDPVFQERFLANPFEVSRELGASRAQAQGFSAMGAAGLGQLTAQMESIRSALGPGLMNRIAGDVGVQMLMGRALADRQFALRLQKSGEAAAAEMLGKTKSASEAAAIMHSAEFGRLNGFQAQRLALSSAGKHFYVGSALEGAKAALREQMLQELQNEARGETARIG